MPVVSSSFEHPTSDSMIRLGTTSILRELLGGGSGVLHLSSPSTNLTRRLEARGLFRVPPCRSGTMHLQKSMFSPEFKPMPYGMAVGVTNHYTEWAVLCYLTYQCLNIVAPSVYWLVTLTAVL
ncbi:hypothetical protein TNCV_2810631 [Trichonephila clavipes]|nr:hypothetical protein TNCV_2810631 [Trichonephila clavipes]